MRGRAFRWATLLVLVAGVPAWAQIRCLSSFPAPGSRLEGPPDRVVLWMNEPVDLGLSRFQVLDLYGRRFDLSPRTSADGRRVEIPLRPLPDGTYLVHYRAASVLDGHVVVGLYRFGVRTPVPTPGGSWFTQVMRAVGAVLTVAAVASGSLLAAALAATTALVEWVEAVRSTVPAPWSVLLRNGWAGLLLFSIPSGWGLLLASATTAAWAIPNRSLLRLVAAGWLVLTVPVLAAAGGGLRDGGSARGGVPERPRSACGGASLDPPGAGLASVRRVGPAVRRESGPFWDPLGCPGCGLYPGVLPGPGPQEVWSVSRAAWDLIALTSLLAAVGGGVLAYGLRRNERAFVWVGTAVLATAALLATQLAYLPKVPDRNPVPPTAQSVEAGKRLYRAHCAVCHGPEGRGDGPAALSLTPRPADLRRTARMPDALLFSRITEGLPGTAMPAFRDVLTEEERWHVVNYLRRLVRDAEEGRR